MNDQPQQKTEKTQEDRPAPPWKQPSHLTSSFVPAPSETGHIISAAEEPIQPKSAKIKKIALAVIAFAVILALSGAGLFLFNYINNPLRLIAKSFEYLNKANSFTVNATFTEDQDFGKASVMLDYQKAPLVFSRTQVKITNINKEPLHNLTALFIFNSVETFFQATYSKIDIIENELTLVFPEILSLRSYQVARPLLKGEKWLHIETPETEEGYQEGGIEISEEKEKELNEKFVNSVIVRNHKRNFEKDSEQYHKIILGFDKEKLIEFIETVKTLDLEVELKDINALIKIVQSVESWDKDLVEILIEKEGNLHSLSLSLPKIPDDALKVGIKESVNEKSAIGAFSDILSDKISGILEKPSAAELIYIGKAVFSNYNRAPGAEKPAEIIEVKELTLALEKDMPIILQMMLLQLQEVPQQELNLEKLPHPGGEAPKILPEMDTRP